MESRELESIVQKKPVLWVGAGLSVAAGCPSTGTIVSALRAAADRDLPDDGEFTTIVDAFVEAVGAGELGDVLQGLFQSPREPTPTHHAIARLAAAGHFTALVTTNYDDLLERALAAAGVKVVIQVLEDNAELRVQDGALRLLKIHGSQDAWHRIVLSGRSYAEFDARYGFLREQLDVLLRQHSLLFVGCSLQDPRILQWLETRPAAWLNKLKRWRAVLQPTAWAAAMAMTWKSGTAGMVLALAPLRPIEIQNHTDLPALWLELARKLAPLAVGELVFDLQPGEHEWRSVGPTAECAPHIAPNPLGDDQVLRDLGRLRTLMRRPVRQGDDPQAVAQVAELRHVARRLGARLTNTLLSPAALDAVHRRIAEVERGTARLTLRVGRGPLADRTLALPWELLMLEDGRFAVEDAKLDLVRDAVTPDSPGLAVPSTQLSVAATIAAPDDQTSLYYEDESYRMFKALAPLGQVAHFADLGELDDLVELISRTEATAVHFSGHGLPGQLVFEDELGLSHPVPVIDLITKIRQRIQKSGVPKPFPGLFYLASCHGASSEATPAGSPEPNNGTLRAELSAALGDGPSTAATLHSEGFACVIGYFGPIGDAISTSAEVALYTALSEGDTVLHAAKQARAQLSKPHTHADQPYHYPLAWAQLAVYLRGPDRPLTAQPHSAAPAPLPPPRLARDIVTVSGLPVLEHGFVGRRGLRHEVRRRLKRGQRLFVLQGLGGLGKTALAVHLLRTTVAPHPDDQLILRVQDADSVTSLRTQAEEHGTRLGIPGWTDILKDLYEQDLDPAEGVRRTVLALLRHRPTLAVYADNMEALQVGPHGQDEDPGTLGAWTPEGERWWAAMESLAESCFVIASTRYAWHGLSPHAFVPLKPMSRDDLWRMADTIPTFARLPWTVRGKIVDRTDGRPRTLVLLEGLLLQADDDPTREIQDLWTEWVEPVLVQQSGKLTADLLLDRLWSLLSSDAREHFVAVSVLQQPAPLTVVDALGGKSSELIRSGLLTRHGAPHDGKVQRPAQSRWAMLSAIRQFVLSKASPEDLAHAAPVAAKAFHEAISTVADQLETIRLYREAGDVDTAWPLVRELATFLHAQGAYRDALSILEPRQRSGLGEHNRAAYDLLIAQLRVSAGMSVEDLVEPALADVASDAPAERKIMQLHTLATIQSYQGQYADAEATIRRQLPMIEAEWGTNCSIYLKAMSALANAVSNRGDYNAAIATNKAQLAAVEKDSPDEIDPALHTILHNLATNLLQAGHYPEAEHTIRRALQIKQKAEGETHPGYGRALQTLGQVLLRQGELDAAISALRTSEAILKRSLGDDHPEYSIACGSLASLLDDIGGHDEAERLMLVALNIQEKRGKAHPGYTSALGNYATMLAEHGKLDKAEELLRDSLLAQEQTLGRVHPLCGITRLNLGLVLANRGFFADAMPLISEALSILDNRLGREHPEQVRIFSSAAAIFARHGRLPEGITWMRHALRIAETALGYNHPSYVSALCDLAHMLSDSGDHPGAAQLLEQYITAQTGALGEHPVIYWPLYHQAVISFRQNRRTKARRLFERSLAIARTILDPAHPRIKLLEESLHEFASIRSLLGLRQRRPRSPR